MNFTPDEAYSKAFEKLALRNGHQTSADVIGLLAYALYKSDKREFIRGGNKTPEQIRSHHDYLTERVTAQYQDSAVRLLENYAAEVLRNAEPDIKRAAETEAIVQAKTEIIEAVRESTSWKASIIYNVIAWLVSLAITGLVLFGSGRFFVSASP